MLKKIAFSVLLLAMASLLVISCGGGGGGNNTANTNESGPGEKPAFQSAGDEGTITGKILFTGAAPAPKTIDMG